MLILCVHVRMYVWYLCAVGYGGVFGVYLVVGVIGYFVFGTFLDNNDSILQAVTLYSTIGPVLPILAQVYATVDGGVMLLCDECVSV